MTIRIKWILFFASASIIAFIGFECSRVILENKMREQVALIQKRGTSWQTIAPGAMRREYILGGESGVKVIVYCMDPKQFSFHFAQNDHAPQTMRQWAEQFPKNTLMINGVYFSKNNTPIGFLVSNKAVVSKKQFSLKKSGVIILSPAPAIIDTSKDKVALETITEGAQSYPVLIYKGKPASISETNQYARRTVFGMDTKGNACFGIIPEHAVSLYELTNILTAMDLSWQDVINLDGGTSTGLSASFSGHQELINSLVSVPNIIVVEKKK